MSRVLLVICNNVGAFINLNMGIKPGCPFELLRRILDQQNLSKSLPDIITCTNHMMQPCST